MKKMKKIGVLGIAIAIALVMSVGAASASMFVVDVEQMEPSVQAITNANPWIAGGDDDGDTTLIGSTINQAIHAVNVQVNTQLQNVVVVQMGDINILV